MNAILEWLWDVAVKPILDELGFTQMPPLTRFGRGCGGLEVVY